jgi:hypothetical protein
MYYNRSKESMLSEPMKTAAFGVRQHYHAWNDVQGWGKDIRDDDFLEDLIPVEGRIRLLNQFDPVAPKLPLLIIYNFPYMLNWYPDIEQKSYMGGRNIDWQGVVNNVWYGGYPCATIPSTWLERGTVTVREDGKVQIKDRIFDAVIILQPQYAKPATLAFLKELTDKKGALMVLGEATLDFNGNDCSALYKEIAQHAVPFGIDRIDRLGIAPNPVANGIYLQDGSLVMSDYQSVKTKTNTVFTVKLGEDEFSGSYEGVFALKTDKNGKIEKMAGGNFHSLQKNGKTILELKTPTDILIKKVGGKTVITLNGMDNEVLVNEL